MTVELTIQEMFDNCPTLFKERADCLDHLFCTIGTGYYWENGELVERRISKKEKKALEQRLVNGKVYQHNKLSLRGEAKLFADKFVNSEISERCPELSTKLRKLSLERVNKEPDDVFYREPLRRKRWYFYAKISKQKEFIDFHENYAYLFNYPEDIMPDWKEAIEECRQLLIDDGYELPEPNNTRLRK